MKAIWIGRIFCEDTATQSSRPTRIHLNAPAPLPCSSCRPSSARTLSASAWATPERAMATAKAPSMAYDRATVAPPPRPPLKALRVPSRPRPPNSPPTTAPMISASTTCTRQRLRTSISATASTTAFIVELLANETNPAACGRKKGRTLLQPSPPVKAAHGRMSPGYKPLCTVLACDSPNDGNPAPANGPSSRMGEPCR